MPDNTHFPAIRRSLNLLALFKRAPKSIHDAAMKELAGAEQLREALGRMEKERSLRLSSPHPWAFRIETPPQHRIRGQGAAFDSGCEHGYMGFQRGNPYSSGNAQWHAWETGFGAGAKLFCEDLKRLMERSALAATAPEKGAKRAK